MFVYMQVVHLDMVCVHVHTCVGGSAGGVKEKRGQCVFMKKCGAVMVAKQNYM